MRPARTVEGRCGAENNYSGSPHAGKSINSSFVPPSEIADDAADLDSQDVWKGDSAEQDWTRCHMLMKRLGRDGRKLELWKKWLGGYYSDHGQLGHLLEKGKQKQKQWTQDSGHLPSEVEWANKSQRVVTEGASPVLKHVAAVLRVHVSVLAIDQSLLSHFNCHVSGRRLTSLFYIPGLTRPVPGAFRALWAIARDEYRPWNWMDNY